MKKIIFILPILFFLGACSSVKEVKLHIDPSKFSVPITVYGSYTTSQAVWVKNGAFGEKWGFPSMIFWWEPWGFDSEAKKLSSENNRRIYRQTGVSKKKPLRAGKEVLVTGLRVPRGSPGQICALFSTDGKKWGSLRCGRIGNFDPSTVILNPRR